MNVLVVDDDRTTRFLMRRALTTDLACMVTEAADGLEALKALREGDFGLVVLDVQMPRLDGVETLRRIRNSPDHRALPVVMLTAERTDRVVRQIVELGVLDYMSKPLTPTRITERVRRVLAWLAAENGPSATRFLAEGLSLLDAKPRMLVVDGDETFRNFFAETLGPEQVVLHARTGVEGLRVCVESRPDVVFIGDGLGVLGEALLVRKIRANAVLQHTQLIAVISSNRQQDRASHQEGYNGRISRTDNPILLMRAVKALLRPAGGGLQELNVVHPALRQAVASGAEQVIGMMLERDIAFRQVTTAPEGERVLVRQRGAWTVNTSGVEFRLYCDERSGRAVAGQLLGLDPALMREEDIVSGASELSNMISGRLRAVLATKGLKMEFDLPEVFRVTEAIPPERPGESMNLSFGSANGNLEFWVVLSTDTRPTEVIGLDLSAGEGQNPRFTPA